MKLRQYQIEAIHQLRDGFRKNNRLILCLPTGSGKTVIFSEIVRLTAEKGNQCLILTDRVELFEQTFRAIDRHGILIQRMTAGTRNFDPKATVTVAMVETYKRRKIEAYEPQLIVIDEAHKGNFTKVMDKHPYSKVIGATATPVGKHLYKYFDDIVETIDIQQLVEQGYLSPCKAYQMQDDFSDLTTRRGDYTEESLYSHFNKRSLYDGVVDQWLERARGKKTLVFNVNIEHAEAMHANFLERGIDSRVLTSRTPKEERTTILEGFARGDFPVLNNCGILTTGYDEPSIECIVMNRKTKSLPLWLQCCGRGSRIYERKAHFTVLDFGMNHDELGLWEEKRHWKLEPPKKKKKQAAPVKECKRCEAMLHASAKNCPFCGYEFKQEVEQLKEGTMVEVSKKAPEHLVGKKIGSLSVHQLIELQNSGRYSKPYIWRIVRSMGKDAISLYGSCMGYKKGWYIRQYQQMGDSQFTNYTIK
jgi:superfamily II DNA or RNA helicase